MTPEELTDSAGRRVVVTVPGPSRGQQGTVVAVYHGDFNREEPVPPRAYVVLDDRRAEEYECDQLDLVPRP